MFQDITVQELLELQSKRELALIDVRSPGEYQDFTIPGSLNIPLFTNEERSEIGTIYKQVSIQSAKDRGLEIVSAKLPAFIKQFEAIEPRKAVFCWRGGMRSRTSATLLSLMGIRVYRLSGGIRAYRQWVVSALESFEFKPKVIVIGGNTGTGKTAILHKLAELGHPVLDIEKLAGHRGSIFGQIGLKPYNQKTFESMLVHELLQLGDQPYIVMEAESRRIGKVVMPEFLVQAKENGQLIMLEMPMEERIRHIMADYLPHDRKEECLAAFEHIRRRIHTPIAATIERHMLMNQFEEAVALLLEYYYDPRYEHAEERYPTEPIRISAENIDDAVEQIERHIKASQS
ncbi:tRNA 2-selenouridine(34) synthase MnmH [Paenibacillus cremeus]|uniref:tRNA 2-selenouridine(34) synthase MnmH n=1 Tax=Paenibacillus cremeus TaxID=2163881 RepID=A0A559K3J3_9BACL|nr:tRNA 2-selenouridine(34) synthase MnmH [Paenibacillus cremeus]TVY06701.1 tRNA 2-selenouridine(34) synthase MnmH [Paenibacillus cremeus]